jgi:hypothetical protein
MEEKIEKIEQGIISVWNNVVSDLSINTATYSSEKSVVFKFAWKFSEWSRENDYKLIIDLSAQCLRISLVANLLIYF